MLSLPFTVTKQDILALYEAAKSLEYDPSSVFFASCQLGHANGPQLCLQSFFPMPELVFLLSFPIRIPIPDLVGDVGPLHA